MINNNLIILRTNNHIPTNPQLTINIIPAPAHQPPHRLPNPPALQKAPGLRTQPDAARVDGFQEPAPGLRVAGLLAREGAAAVEGGCCGEDVAGVGGVGARFAAVEFGCVVGEGDDGVRCGEGGGGLCGG